MGYPEHALLQFGGPLYGTDVWSCGLRMSIDSLFPGNSSTAWAEASLEDVAEDVKNYVSSWNVSSGAKLEFVKFNIIDAAGHYLNKSETNVKFFLDPMPAGSGAGRYPPQVSIALTHHTDLNRGPGSKGRMFLPAPSAPISGEIAQISAADALAYADAHATFIKNLNEWPGPDPTSGGEVRIFSKIGAGSSNKVTSVSCGRMLDTIRSRRNKFPEDPVKSTVAL